jgi:hypothetical protein
MRKNRNQRQKIDHESMGINLARIREQLRVILNQQFMYTVNPTHRRISRLTDNAVHFVDTLRDQLESIAARELPAEVYFKLYHPHIDDEIQFEKELLSGVPCKTAEEFQTRASRRENAFCNSEKFIPFDSDDRTAAAIFLFSCRNTLADVKDQAAGRLPDRQASKIQSAAGAAITALFHLSFAIERCLPCR